MQSILYLLFSYLLLGLGVGFYQFFVRRRATVAQRRMVLYTVLGLSLSLPLAFLPSDALFRTAQPHEPIVFHNEPLLTKELLLCYAKATTKEGLCRCEEQQQLNLVHYKKNAFYDAVQAAEPLLLLAFSIIGSVFLIGLFWRLWRLHRIIAAAETQFLSLDGKVYWLLKTDKFGVAASFRLRKRYIIWHSDLNRLTEQEQQAVLQHEIGHLEHGDTYQKIVLNLLQIVWGLHPLFYTLKKELALLDELRADAFAVQRIGERKLYATLLLRLKSTTARGLLNALEERPLQLRIKNLFATPPKRQASSLILVFLLGAMLSVSVAIAPFLRQQTINFSEYCYLQAMYEASGQAVFCKDCLAGIFSKN